jgi:glycosyltransferase involved in cell wall biosynthesis
MTPPDLLLITWNRKHYLEKTIEHLLKQDQDFRLYCWDNASADGTGDIINSINDPRVVKKVFSKENVKQREPCLWFLENAKSDVVGKIDDDILLPDDWINTLLPLIRSNPNYGMLACWIFMESDWDENLAKHKIKDIDGQRIFHTSWVAGQSFLAKKEVLKKYITNDGYGFPIDQMKMTIDGYINGYPLPLMFAHNMDEPRSPSYFDSKGFGEHGALTARVRGFKTNAEYANWIAQDARNQLTYSLAKQLSDYHQRLNPSLRLKIKRKILSILTN